MCTHYTLHTTKGVTKHLSRLNTLCICIWISFHLAQLSHGFPQNLCICVPKKGSCCLPWFLCHYLKRGWVWLQVWNRAVEECTLEWMQLLATGLESTLRYLVVLEKRFSIYCAFNFRAPLSVHEYLSQSGLLLWDFQFPNVGDSLVGLRPPLPCPSSWGKKWPPSSPSQPTVNCSKVHPGHLPHRQNLLFGHVRRKKSSKLAGVTPCNDK